jgi:hypothetical protein
LITFDSFDSANIESAFQPFAIVHHENLMSLGSYVCMYVCMYVRGGP